MDRINVQPRLLLFAVVLLLLVVVLWLARGVLWPFVLGLVLAYLMVPLVNRVERTMPSRSRDGPYGRLLAIVSVYLAFAVVVAIALALILPPLLRQAGELLSSAPELYETTEDRVLEWVGANRALVPPQLETLVADALEGDILVRVAGPAVDLVKASGLATWGAVSSTIGLMLGLVLVPIWLVYILRDSGRVREAAIHLIPHDIRPDVEALRIVGDRVLSGYIRGQLVIALTLGVLFTLALVSLGVPYSLLLGFVAGVFGLVPFIGAVIGAVPAVAVAFTVSLKLSLLVMAAFAVIQLVDNMLITPRTQGRAVALSPAVIMVVVVIGQRLLGPAGMLVAVPLTAFLRDLTHYLYLRLGEDRPTAAQALETVGYGAYTTNIVRHVHSDPDGG